MSYESDQNNGEFYQEVSPLHRYFSDMHYLDDYTGVYLATERFMVEQFASDARAQVTEEMTNSLVAQMYYTQTIPSLEYFEYDTEGAKEQFRVALYDVAVPMYERLFSEQEVDEWLPAALDVVVPHSSRHRLASCLAVMGDNGINCHFGPCPRRHVAQDVRRSLLTPDFSSLEYIVDPEKKFTNTVRRLECAASRGILGGGRAGHGDILFAQYEQAYRERFPSLQ